MICPEAAEDGNYLRVVQIMEEICGVESKNHVLRCSERRILSLDSALP